MKSHFILHVKLKVMIYYDIINIFWNNYFKLTKVNSFYEINELKLLLFLLIN